MKKPKRNLEQLTNEAVARASRLADELAEMGLASCLVLVYGTRRDGKFVTQNQARIVASCDGNSKPEMVDLLRELSAASLKTLKEGKRLVE